MSKQSKRPEPPDRIFQPGYEKAREYWLYSEFAEIVRKPAKWCALSMLGFEVLSAALVVVDKIDPYLKEAGPLHNSTREFAFAAAGAALIGLAAEMGGEELRERARTYTPEASPPNQE